MSDNTPRVTIGNIGGSGHTISGTSSGGLNFGSIDISGSHSRVEVLIGGKTVVFVDGQVSDHPRDTLRAAGKALEAYLLKTYPKDGDKGFYRNALLLSCAIEMIVHYACLVDEHADDKAFQYTIMAEKRNWLPENDELDVMLGLFRQISASIAYY